VHQPGRAEHHGWEGRGSPIKSLTETINVHEQVAGLVRPSRVLAIALDTHLLTESAARAEIDRVTAETGLPTDDPIRYGAERLLDALRAALP